MDVSTITMDPKLAKEKFREYRTYLHSKVEREYAQIAKAYKIAGQGRPIVNLTEAMRNQPSFPNGMPKLAIVRADHRSVFCERWGNTVVYNAGGRWPGRARSLSFRFTDVAGPHVGGGVNGTTLAPMIPIEARRKAGMRRNMENLFILWEVEQWNMTPPVDPFLLTHIGGDLYAVLAEWNLTEIERAVMAGRART